MIGILTEKPSAARNFAKALGGNKGRYNGEEYVIVNAVGHVYEYVDPDQHVHPSLAAKYKSWSMSYLPWRAEDFGWKKKLKPKVSKVTSDIKNTLSKCSEIVIATDVDPTGEGAVLAIEILDELNLIGNKRFTRMYFIDESEVEIQKAFVGRKQIGNPLVFPEYLKGLTRAKYDYLTMQFTRIATTYGYNKTVLRQGRLKSAMTRIVGEQLEAIANYKKVPFYEARFKDENGNVFKDPNASMYPTKEQVPLASLPMKSKIIIDSTVTKTSAPPKLLDLAGLSGILADKGVKPKEVLNVYQKMYEAQIVSYPRTEDNFISPEQFNELLPLVDRIADVVGVDKGLLLHRVPRKTHVKVGGAHGANRPGKNVPMSLSTLETTYGKVGAQIYEILAKNYLAMLALDYEYEQQKAHLELCPTYVATANTPKKYGFKAIFNNDDDDESLSGKSIGYEASRFVHEGFPPKPTQPSVKWLMKQLDKHEVGTGATRTSTLADVTSGKTALMKDTRGKLSLTDSGERSYMLLPGTEIGDLTMTERLFTNMKRVEKGEVTPEQVIGEVARLVLHDIKVMEENSKKIKDKLGVKTDMAYETKEKYEGTWKGKQVSFTRKWSTHRFTDDECARLCNGEKIQIELMSKNNTPYKIEGELQDQSFTNDQGKKINFVGFKNLGFVQNDSVPASWCNHRFTEDERILLEGGKEVYIEGFVSKAGNTFNATVSYGVNPETGRKGIIPKF